MSKGTLEIFFSSDTDLSEWEATSKGWRNDVYVSCNNLIYHLNVYTPVRLVQDFETEIDDYGFYCVDENLILVVSTEKDIIISTIVKLYDGKYFEKIKPYVDHNHDSLVKVY